MTAKTRWIIAIVGLLAGNLVAMGVLMASARSGGSQVIPQYYDKAVHYDDAIDQAAKNRALGWRVTPHWAGGEVAVDIRDAQGVPITDATVTVDKRARTAGQTRGIHDLTITARRGTDVFVQTATLETP